MEPLCYKETAVPKGLGAGRGLGANKVRATADRQVWPITGLRLHGGYGEHRLLNLPAQGRQAGVATACMPGHAGGPGSVRKGLRHHAAGGLPVAIQHQQRTRNY